jgi:negative regulator of flagellin synthesis FlgM
VTGKLSGVSSGPPASPATRAAGARATLAAAAGAAPGSGAGGATDSVQITDAASQLATAEQTLTDLPVINSSRVAATSDALANGTYRISAERIANQLLKFERLLPKDTVA